VASRKVREEENTQGAVKQKSGIRKLTPTKSGRRELTPSYTHPSLYGVRYKR
jgi:hypothetical protein